MAERPTIRVKPGHPGRDPRRPRVRGGPTPQAAAAPKAGRPGHAPAPPPAPRPAPRPARQATAASPAKPAPKPARQSPPVPAAKAVGASAPKHVAKRAWDDLPQRRPASAPAAPPGPPAAAALPPAAGAAVRAATAGLRLNKLMTERGIASRREADEWIAAGFVRVDGVVAQLGQRVAADAVIDIDERARQEQQRRVTVLLHKPLGWVSGQPEDGHEAAVALVTAANQWDGDRSGIRFHPGHLRHLAPAGRLDIDSTGLLVLTQDGRVARHLIGDETRVEKEYLVRVARVDGAPPQSTDIAPLRHGLVLDGVALRPAQASWQNEQQLRIVLREGRKRQIRRMCEQLGLKVLALKRVRIGRVPLGPLPEGRWRYLRDDERF